jgi:periplasmic protein CpxP/Spy
MSKKTLNIVLVALLLVNVTTLAMLWMKPGKGHHAPPPAERLFQDLGFDQVQKDAFIILRDKHRQSAQELEKANHQLRQQYSTLIQGQSVDQVDSLARLVGENVAQLEMLHFYHFQEIRKLCRADQLERFDHMLEKMSKGVPGPPPPGGPPPHGPHH